MIRRLAASTTLLAALGLQEAVPRVTASQLDLYLGGCYPGPTRPTTVLWITKRRARVLYPLHRD